MKILLRCIGKTNDKSIEVLNMQYINRLKHYNKVELQVMENLKKTRKLPEDIQKEKEGTLLLSDIKTDDYVVLLDENGSSFTSVDFSKFMQQIMNRGPKRLIFMIGGPYGFSAEVYARANSILSLSKMTFSHQMVRPFFLEQLYRAFTILRNEPYHHQ